MKRQKRKMRDRHAGRLELRGRTFIARWMSNKRRFSQSTGVRIDAYPDESSARLAAEQWLARKLATVRQYDTIRRTEKDEELARVSAAKLLKSDLNEIDEIRASSASDVPPLSVSEAFDALLKSPSYRTPKPQTIAMTRQRFNRFTKWLVKNHPTVTTMRDVSHAVAKQFAGELKTQLGAATYNTYLVSLSQIWNVLADEIGTPNPWATIPKQTKVETYRRPFTDAELSTIFSAAEKAPDGANLVMLLSIMLYTGARLSDACLMRWESIDFGRGMIDFTAVKTRTRCRPPLVRELRELLERTPPQERHGEILPSFAEEYRKDPGATSNRITSFLKSAGIETSTPVNGRNHATATAHSFRHTYISRCGTAGVPLAVVQGWVGHLSAEMSAHYFHESDAATIAYASTLPTMRPALVHGDVIDLAATAPAEAADAAEARYRTFCEIVGQMDADERARAAHYLASLPPNA